MEVIANIPDKTRIFKHLQALEVLLELDDVYICFWTKFSRISSNGGKLFLLAVAVLRIVSQDLHLLFGRKSECSCDILKFGVKIEDSRHHRIIKLYIINNIETYKDLHR